jgi:hypothetical protein
MTYPERPANMPEAIEVDVRIKVVLHWYETEDQAKIAGDYFRKLAYHRSLQGFDFGWWTPGYQGPDRGMFLAVEG